MGSVLSVQLGAAVATTLFDELGPSGTVLLRTGFAAVILVAIWRPEVPRGRQRAAARRRPARDRAGGDEPQLLRGARPDPAGDRGDARVHGAVRGRGRRVAARQRPRLGGARGRRDPPAVPRRARLARRPGRGVRAARGRASGPPTSCWRRGSAAGSAAARASPWRWRWRRSSSSRSAWPAAAAPWRAPACSRSASRSPCSAPRSPTRWSSRRCGGSRRGRSGS